MALGDSNGCTKRVLTFWGRRVLWRNKKGEKECLLFFPVEYQKGVPAPSRCGLVNKIGYFSHPCIRSGIMGRRFPPPFPLFYSFFSRARNWTPVNPSLSIYSFLSFLEGWITMTTSHRMEVQSKQISSAEKGAVLYNKLYVVVAVDPSFRIIDSSIMEWGCIFLGHSRS